MAIYGSMDDLFFILLILGFGALGIWVISSLIGCATNSPTWEGIILSAIMGMLPLYLVLCFFGVMGEPRDEE